MGIESYGVHSFMEELSVKNIGKKILVKVATASAMMLIEAISRWIDKKNT